MLINEGLIEIIEIQLKEYVATMKCEHQQKITEDLSKSNTSQGKINHFTAFLFGFHT